MDTSCDITPVELLHETLGAIAQAAKEKVLAPPVEAEAPPAAKGPAKGEHGPMCGVGGV